MELWNNMRFLKYKSSIILLIKAIVILFLTSLIEFLVSDYNRGVIVYSIILISIALFTCLKNFKYKKFEQIVKIIYLLSYCYSVSSIFSNGVTVISLDKKNIVFYIILSVLCCLRIWKLNDEAYDRKWNIYFIEYAITFLINVMFWFFPFWNLVETKGWSLALLFYMVMYLWSLELLRLVEHLIIELSHKEWIFANKHIGEKKPWITIFLMLAIWGFFLSIIFYPGIITYDNAVMYSDAFNLNNADGRSDLHSFFYVVFIRLCMSLWNNYWFLTVLMVVLFSLVWATLMTYLYRRGISFSTVVGITFFWMIIPSNMYLLISTWKDVPFTICMLLLQYVLFRAVCDREKLKPINIVFLFVSVIGTALFRSNGLVVVLLTTMICLLIGLKEKINRNTIISFALALMCVCIIKGPLYSAIGVKSTPSGFAALPMLDGVWENIHKGIILPDSMNELLEKIEPKNGFEEEYKENSMNVGVMPEDYLSIDLAEAFDAYKWCLQNHPAITIVARLKKSYNMWGVFSNPLYYEWSNKITSISNFSNLGVKENWYFLGSFELLRECILNSYDDNYFIGSVMRLIGRSGWNMLIWFGCFIILLERRKARCIIAILPAFFNVIALSIGTVSPDYRYTYPMFALSIPFYLYVLSEVSIPKEKQLV